MTTANEKGICMKQQQALPALGKTVDDDGFVCLAGQLLWKYRAVDAEFRNAHLALVQKQGELDAELQKHEKVRALLLDKATMARLAAEKQSELKGVHHEIEALIGVPLANCAIDDQTGRIYVLSDGGGKTGLRERPSRPQKQKQQRQRSK